MWQSHLFTAWCFHYFSSYHCCLSEGKIHFIKSGCYVFNILERTSTELGIWKKELLNRETDRQTDRQTDTCRQEDRQMDRMHKRQTKLCRQHSWQHTGSFSDWNRCMAAYLSSVCSVENTNTLFKSWSSLMCCTCPMLDRGYTSITSWQGNKTYRQWATTGTFNIRLWEVLI